MMHIELTTADEQRLAKQAVVNGFATTEAYVADVLRAYAELTVDSSDSSVFERSVSALEESLADVAAGRTRDFTEAMRELTRTLNVPFNR